MNMDYFGRDDNSNEFQVEFNQWNRSSEDILKNRYPLHKACRDGDIESVSLLLVSSGQQQCLLEDEFYGWTPAHWASYFGKLACLRKLMQCLSADPVTSRYQQSPTHLAAYACRPNCLHWLLSSGSDLNQKDYLGETPAHKAARTGSMECVALLAAKHADLNAQNNTGMTPGHLAAKCGYPDCALYLEKSAQQQILKRNGVIDDVVLPVLQSQSVLPGNLPNKCVIIQGINGGKLPQSIDSHQSLRSELTNGMDVEMDSGDHLGNAHQNGHMNGHHTNGGAVHPSQNGSLSCGRANSAFIQKDIMLSHDVSNNRSFVAGRKRGREDVDEDVNEEWKRVRYLELGDFQGQSNVVLPSSQPIMSNGCVAMTTDEPIEQPNFVTSVHPNSIPIVRENNSFVDNCTYRCSYKYKNSPCI